MHRSTGFTMMTTYNNEPRSDHSKKETQTMPTKRSCVEAKEGTHHSSVWGEPQDVFELNLASIQKQEASRWPAAAAAANCDASSDFPS